MSNRQKRKWHIKENSDDKNSIIDISSKLGCSEILATLLFNRGYQDFKSADKFIRKNQEILHDPFLLNDMDKAVSRILTAVNNEEQITIYGDYDVDGVTSVSILHLYLEKIGAKVNYYIPCRKGEGYGVSVDALTKLKENGTNLIITVDTGVTAINEVDYAKDCGIDVVITDHHECTDILPNAVAVINPKRRDTTYPFSHLAGVGVVFKLLCAIEASYNKIDMLQATKKIAIGYADLTAIGTIADVMPVIDENRIIVAYGLDRAEKTDKIGLEVLIKICRNGDGKVVKGKVKKKLSSGFIGFTIAPRINAAGRISSASTAVELFLSKNEATAEKYALELCEINRERQFTENKIAEEAYEIIEENGYFMNSMIILDNPLWHHGVIGIVSSRVSDKYGIPSILISFEGNENPNDPEAIGKGSGRSVPGMNLVEALSTCSDLLDKFGGHELAAGLTVKRKNLPLLKQRLEQYAKECFKDGELERLLEIDSEINTSQISLSLAQELTVLEPYGVSNPAPTFACKNMVIEDIIPVGMNRHIRLTLSKDGKQFSAMLFSVSPEEFWLNISDEVDIAFNIETNEFAGNISLQISIKDICASERARAIEEQNEKMYAEAKEGKSMLGAEYIIPERNDFAIVYNHLLCCARCGQNSYSFYRLTNDLCRTVGNGSLNYVKIKLIIKVFRELNIISINDIDSTSFKFKFSFTKNKTSLDKSNILKKLKSMYQTKK